MDLFRRLAWKLTRMSPTLWHQQPSPVANTSVQSLGAILRAEMNDMVCKVDQLDQAEQSWSHYCKDLAVNVERKNSLSFLRWPIIRDTMFVSCSPYLDEELAYLRGHRSWEKRWKPALQETTVGGPDPYWSYPWTSGNTIHHLYHVARFMDAVGGVPEDWDLVFEFGGGYGNLC